MTDHAIQFCGVTMRYAAGWRARIGRRAGSATTALRDLNVCVETGARVAVFGENGAGKSTLLRLVAGMLIPSAGRVLVHGEDAGVGNARARRRVGYVLAEERSFYFRLSGLENLRFFAALHELFGRAAEAEALRLLDCVGLGGSARRPVAEYSTGMRQRLALARGLLSNPEILLLDEPTRSLDPAGTEAVHALLGSSLLAKRTLLLATNRFEDAVQLCRRVVVLRHGTLAATRELSHDTTVEALACFVREQLSDAAAPC